MSNFDYILGKGRMYKTETPITSASFLEAGSKGGRLLPEQADKFIDDVTSTHRFLQEIDVVRMNNQRMQLDYLTMSTRNMRKLTENTQLDATAIDTYLNTLTAVRSGIDFVITDEFLSRNIERQRVEGTLRGKFSQQTANDLLDCGINGNAASGDPFLSINDGWVRLASVSTRTNKVNSSTYAGDITGLFNATLDALPDKYFFEDDGSGKEAMVIITTRANVKAYREWLKARATPLGDQTVTKDGQLAFDGVPVMSLRYMPDDTLIYTKKENFVLGMELDITIESQRQARKRAWDYALTLSWDAEFRMHDALVIAAPGLV